MSDRDFSLENTTVDRKSGVAGALFLIIYAISVIATIYSRTGIAARSMVLFCFLIAGRATYAAFRLHSLQRKIPSDPLMIGASKLYDAERWRALLVYDRDVALVAEKLRPLGDKWVDQFARDYLALNDKRYLMDIVKKVIADARNAAVLAERAGRAREDWHT